MDIFYNCKQLTTIKERQEYLYLELNKKLGESDIYDLNPGYFPLNELVKNEKEILQHYMSLYLFLLKDIDTTDKILLDLACGRGGAVNTYKKYMKLKNIYAMDNSELSINFCKSKYSGINFDLMDLNNIEYENNSFDIITCVDTSLNTIISDNKTLFDKIYKLLKDGGVFIIAEPEYETENIEYLNKIFNKVDQINITQNLIDSSTNILRNIHKFNLNLNEKQYIEYSALITHKDYLIMSNKFIKYICYKGEKNV
jgi:ubiquinone/menaquinone biosynthesis C-methylase UbiE